MLIKGQMFATSDMEIVNNAAMQGYKLIYIGDQLEIPSGYKFVNAITFTPDYQTMSAIIEGDTQRFNASYINMLSSPAAEELFAIIIGALNQGSFIMIYFPHDTLQLAYPYLLLQYLQDRFGITVGDKESPFMYNPSFDLINMRLLYIYKLIPWNEYIIYTDEVDPVTIMRFKEDLSQLYNIPMNISNEDMVVKIQEIKDKIIASKQNKKKLFETIKEEKK